MKKLNLTLLCCLLVAMTAWAQSTYDAMAPFGFATCTSRTNAGTYDITGGGAYTPEAAAALGSTKSVVTLQSTGSAMDTEIKNAITNNDIIIFDGSQGDFILEAYVTLQNLSNKTLLGINNAKLCTKWFATADDVAALEAAEVSKMSTDEGTGGTLSNGKTVKEQAEFNTRQIMINRYNDQSEWWCKSGIFYIKTCSNFIIRNIQFQGPGAMDLGGADLVSIIDSSHHIWVDHCDFSDGQDGNMDITNYSDFVTVSWCTFHYSGRSYMHQNTNLCGSSNDKTGDDDKLSVTWAYNMWGTGCAARMPMARFGRFHMLNNYYNCAGNKTSCINPRIKSEFLIEGNYFESNIQKIYEEKDGPTKVIWRSNNVYGSKVSSTLPTVDDNTAATTLIPYSYTLISPTSPTVKTEVSTYAGATIFKMPLAPTATVSVSKTEVKQGASVVLTAETNGNPEPTIQWYSCTNAQKANAQAISGATGNTYSPSTTTIGGPYYYYAQVTNSQGSATSNVVSFSVVENTDVVWTFTDATIGEFANNSSGAALSVTGSDGSVLGYYSNTGSNSKITEASATISDIQYTKSLNMGGAGSTNNRYVLTPELSGKGTLTIVYAGNASGTCSIYKNGESSAITTISPVTSTAVTSTEIDLSSGASALKIVHSAKCYIYAIIWTLTGTTPPATKQPVTLAFKNDFKAKVGTEINVSDIVAVTSNGTDVSDNVTPTLVSSKETIASIANGKMTVKAKGTFTLAASFEGNNSYEAAEQITRTVIAYSDEDGEEVESISGGSGTIWGAEQTERMSSSQATTSTGSDINGMDSYYIPSSYNPSGSGNVVYSNDDFSNAKSIKLRTGQAVSNSAKGFSFIVKEGYMINEIKVIGYSNYYNSYPVFKQVLVDDKSENKLSGEVAFPAKVSSGTQSLSNFTVSNLNATKKVDFVIETTTTGSSDSGSQGQFWFVVKYQNQEPTSSIQCVKLIMNKYGRASFSSSYDIDFSNIEGLVAYTGDHINDANGNLVLEPFTGILKAGEGVLLRGIENETYYLPISSIAGTVPSLNLLYGLKPGDLIYASTDFVHNYKFGAQSGKVGFYSVATDYMTGSYGAYLSINGGLSNAAPAAYLLEFDENGATGIAIMENPQGQKTNVRYNISGQRVDSNYRGITIVNGRKVVRK